MSGLRYNNGKLQWGLLSWPALRELVKVLEFGAKKYASWNWSNGLSWTQTFESLQRHAIAWYTGEDKDPETGLSHMAHVLCNSMFLVHFILFNTGKDDRPNALRMKEENETSLVSPGETEIREGTVLRVLSEDARSADAGVTDSSK